MKGQFEPCDLAIVLDSASGKDKLRKWGETALQGLQSTIAGSGLFEENDVSRTIQEGRIVVL